MNKLKITMPLFVSVILCINSFAQVKTNTFQVEKSGRGSRSIIFIPGFTCPGSVWDETKSKFENDFVCYTLTMPGFAGSKPEVNPSFKNWETNIAEYIQKTRIEKPIVIGHSMGGGLALALAADYPDLIGKIIIVDALPCLPALMNPGFKAKENPDCSATLNQITTMSDEQFYNMQKRTVTMFTADTLMQKKILDWSIKSDRKTFAVMYCDFTNTDLREKIKTITCPALILLETSFKDLKPAIEEQYQNLKGADLQYADKALHFIMYDDKDWYFAQLNNFLSPRK